MLATGTIKVLIIDDADVIQRVIARELRQHDNLEVITAASGPDITLDNIIAWQVDAIILDIHVSQTDSIALLRQLMAHYPIPVIATSSFFTEHSRAAEALTAGAMEVIAKPASTTDAEMVYSQLAQKIKYHVAMNREPTTNDHSDNITTQAIMPHGPDKIIAMGASTGGVEALRQILSQCPSDTPGIVIAQHMPSQFTAALAKRLDSDCAMTVREASHGEQIVPGKALIAPGGMHLTLKKNLNQYYAALDDRPAVHHQKPSVDVLFNSVARTAAKHAIGVILTGMGKDGAQGLLKMRSRGAHTIAQDEASSFVFGMPKHAIAANAAEVVAPLSDIARIITQLTCPVG